MAIPRKMIRGLERASTSKLEATSLSPAGDTLSWPSLDVDVYVPGLVEARVREPSVCCTNAAPRRTDEINIG